MVVPERKVIWAVDAFEEKREVLQHAVEALRGLIAREPELRVEPVYVIGPAQLSMASELTMPVITPYRPAAERALAELCAEWGPPNALPSKVLQQAFSATAQAVSTLSEYAEQTGAAMIVLGSHGRHGIKRVLMGSFAEALLLNATLPVMVAGPSGVGPLDFSHLLFPTDFKSNSDLLYRRVIDFAVELKARVTLFHAVPSPIEPVFQSGVSLLGGNWLPVHAYFSKEVERHQTRAEKWARWARRQGVPVEIIIETRAISIAQSILEVAQSHRVGIITMDAESGAFKSALIGSIARQVLRTASCPVWVLRSDGLQRQRMESRRVRAAA